MFIVDIFRNKDEQQMQVILTMIPSPCVDAWFILLCL